MGSALGSYRTVMILNVYVTPSQNSLSWRMVPCHESRAKVRKDIPRQERPHIFCEFASRNNIYLERSHCRLLLDAKSLSHVDSHTVKEYYHVKDDELYSTKRGYFNEPRSAAIFLMRRLRRDSLSEIGHVFHVKKYSTISSTIERLKIRMQKDPKLKKRIENLEAFIYKSQEQT